MTIEQIYNRACQLTTQIDTPNFTAKVGDLISDITVHLDDAVGVLVGNIEAETQATKAHAQLDVARNGIADTSTQPDYEAIFYAIGGAISKACMLDHWGNADTRHWWKVMSGLHAQNEAMI